MVGGDDRGNVQTPLIAEFLRKFLSDFRSTPCKTPGHRLSKDGHHLPPSISAKDPISAAIHLHIASRWHTNADRRLRSNHAVPQLQQFGICSI